MPHRHILAATACLFAIATANSAQAEGRRAKDAHAQHELLEEVRALRSEVASLKAQVNAQAEMQVQSSAANARLEASMVSSQADTKAVDAKLEAIPAAIAASAEKARHADNFGMKGLTITPGGFLTLTGIYRQHFMGNDISSGFNTIPFPNVRTGRLSEARITPRATRLSLLVEGAPNPQTKLSFYGEFDFQGAAQNANSNQSNSFNPRIRNLYGSIDWLRPGWGLHLLAGQNWSLLTMSSHGITPRNEVAPPEIDGQFMPGFVWTRQPQVRLTADFLDRQFWVAVSAENPQTTFGGAVPPNITNVAPGGVGFDTNNTLSLNQLPDLAGKIAYEGKIAGRSIHIEGFGIYRQFSVRNSLGRNSHATGFGFGGGIIVQLFPNLLDAQFSGMSGHGLGRYGSAQLPDVTFAADGTIEPIPATMLLAGLTLHATRRLDIYGYVGEERVSRRDFGSVDGILYGYGNVLANNTGCLTEGGVCNGNSRRVRQVAAGFWQDLYRGDFGRAQIGMQYSFTDRDLFSALGGGPRAKQNMGFISFRYFPF